MSKIENTSNHKDVYSIWSDSVDSFYSNIEKSIPQFHQAATNLLQEYVQAWNNASSSIIDIQREFATKTGIKSNLPESSISMINDSTEKINRSFNVQSKMSIASIDATKHNIHTWNENSKSFVNINKSIMDSLVLPFNPKI
ncbi:hypothetical protein [Nitrosopumilus adriaticus]|uniref:Phasin domain-containing protein n=1 Tax=Nitrosopumilus adriaticus TaxID=1580092 RepID=A0A0D5C1E3_9ARCH|nr:hypothetical protein [Nitrosopumilus adriaticus]AJW70232.1 hypothetical protein NADRNF5_0536 [Nitrosopumilus adriaticus]